MPLATKVSAIRLRAPPTPSIAPSPWPAAEKFQVLLLMLGHKIAPHKGWEKFFTPSGRPRKVHKCSYCEYTTLKTSNLQNHLLVHTGQKPHECSFCRKKFRTKSHLQIHLLTHYKN
ncbi:unnamed protein product [Larinioides sclopetarius]|uniref:C2H2-type domain-containing protein n=1 Tax=Larinioides sclopetarius TaxID=280406 RepID=A0AAV2BV35_9ARAC